MPTSTGGTESSSFESRDIGFSSGSRAKGSLQGWKRHSEVRRYFRRMLLTVRSQC